MKIYKVMLRDSVWIGTIEGNEPVAEGIFRTEVIKKTKAVAMANAPSRMQVYNKKGEVDDEFTYIKIG